MSNFRFIDYPHWEDVDEREIPVSSEQEIRKTLKRFHQQLPRFVDFISPEGDSLTIGVGASLGCVMFIKASGDPPYLWAIGNRGEAEDYIEFDAGGTPTPIPLYRCLPFEDVIEIVVHYFLTGNLTENVEWEED